MIKEEIKAINSSVKQLKKFGLSVGGFLIAISAALLFFEKESYSVFLVIGSILIFSALLFPKFLKPIYKIWMIFSIILGFIMTRIILSVLFYSVITAIGFLSRLFGRKFLDLNFKTDEKSYWNLRSSSSELTEDYERQF